MYGPGYFAKLKKYYDIIQRRIMPSIFPLPDSFSPTSPFYVHFQCNFITQKFFANNFTFVTSNEWLVARKCWKSCKSTTDLGNNNVQSLQGCHSNVKNGTDLKSNHFQLPGNRWLPLAYILHQLCLNYCTQCFIMYMCVYGFVWSPWCDYWSLVHQVSRFIF